jgi:hypothetical protein
MAHDEIIADGKHSTNQPFIRLLSHSCASFHMTFARSIHVKTSQNERFARVPCLIIDPYSMGIDADALIFERLFVVVNGTIAFDSILEKLFCCLFVFTLSFVIDNSTRTCAQDRKQDSISFDSIFVLLFIVFAIDCINANFFVVFLQGSEIFSCFTKQSMQTQRTALSFVAHHCPLRT